MDIHHLRVFASVFKYRSFSKAAEDLSLRQPTVSDHIKSLEEELDCRLFDRLGRMIMPTKEAMLLIGRALEAIERVDGFKSVLDEFRKDLSGHLVIGASTIPGTYILPGLTVAFRKRNPSVLFEVVVSGSRAIVDKVSNHELLIGIVGARLESKQVHYEPFLDDELILAASDTFEIKKSIDARELANYPIVVREQGSGTKREFEKIIEKEGIDPHRLNIVGIFGSTDAIKQAVKEGFGISIVSRRSVEDELKCGLLREIRIKGIKMKRQFYIIAHRKRTLPHLYKTFLDYLFSCR